MQLKDDKGRTVLVKMAYMQGHSSVSLWAKDGLLMEQVQEAVVADGDDVFLDRAYVEHEIASLGIRAAMLVPPTIANCRYSPVNVNCEQDWRRIWANKTSDYKVNGINVTVDEQKMVQAKTSELNEFNGLRYWDANLTSSSRLNLQRVLELIGAGKVVMSDSLMRGCAKGEGRARLVPGDTVEVEMKGKKVLGMVKSMTAKVTVLRHDGVKGSYPYSKVVRATGAVYSASIVGELDASLKDGFEHLKAQTGRMYRAKLERMDVAFPAFLDVGAREQQKTYQNVPTCACPLCGWRMGLFSEYYGDRGDEFKCCYCRVRGIVLDQSEDEVSLLMLRMPGKNRFAIKECRSCSNCGLFHFEHGRQGKRTTGYCRAANQCVQAFNTCNLWFPRDPKTYGSNMKQHATNLGYGVADVRNTSRNDIRDTVYTAEDHELERKRSERACIVYEQSYIKTMDDMKELAKAVPLAAGGPEESEEWQKILDDPC
jgi:hypothetical protein